LGYLDAGAFDVPEVQWGFGSSPIIYEDKVIVLCDVNNQSFITALDLATGKDIWRTLRDENPTWGTPTIHKSKDRTQIIVNGYKHIGGYEVETGKAIWWMHGGGDVPCPTPVVSDGLVFITNAHGRMRPIYAIKLEAEGDISLARDEKSNRHIPWFYPRRGSYQPTPLVLDDLLYIADNGGILTCYVAETGEEMYRHPIGGDISSYSASPVTADGKLYFSDEYGNIHIVKAGPNYEHLAVNKMDEICMASPAISGKTLFIRARRHLYAISKVTN
jgi:outer membrane protein assembly factor BamB